MKAQVTPLIMLQERKRNILERGAESVFLIFCSWLEMFFPGRKFQFGRTLTNFSGFAKVKSKKKKIINCNFSPFISIFHLPFFDFPSFLLHFPFFSLPVFSR